MQNEQEYPSDLYEYLDGFLSGVIADADFEGLDDEETARRFAVYETSDATTSAALGFIIEEGRQVLALAELNWDWLGEQANRSFGSEEEARRWLDRILTVLETSRADPNTS